MLSTRAATATRSVPVRSGSRKSKIRKPGADPNDPTTPERRQHNTISRGDWVEDVAGNYAMPYVVRDLLSAMQTRGTITAEMRDAGETFRENFRRAHLDEMRAADLGRVAGLGGSLAEDLRIMAAKAAVMRAIRAIGEPAGSILWNVVGLEHSLKDWAIGQSWNGRPCHQMQASGILVAALGALVAMGKRG